MPTAVRSDIGPFAMVPLWLVEQASPRALRVYALMAGKWADRDSGQCWPYRSTIASCLDISEDTVDRAIKELSDLGALGIEHQYADNGDQMASLYTLFYAQKNGTPASGPPPQICGGPPADLRPAPRTDAAHKEPESKNENHRRTTIVQFPEKTSSNDNEDATLAQSATREDSTNPTSPPPAVSHQPPIISEDGNAIEEGVPGAKGSSTGRQREVFDAWREIMGKNAGAKLNDRRAAKIKARLKEGYSVQDLISAIAGAKANAWFMGENDRGVVYDDLTTILKDGASVERHMNFTPSEPKFHTEVDRIRAAREAARLRREGAA